MKYRADIDGLRAVAVVAVVLFHAGIEVFSGGYVGVDVFFVISGFLITSIVLSDSDRGRFTIVDFYDRRVRRIFPALFAMLIATTLLAAAILLPAPLVEYAETMIAAVLFASNLYLWRNSGYFESNAELNPLLHTWSLSVEEQFYLFHPILLATIVRFARHRLPVVIIIGGLASFALNLATTESSPVASFYLFPGRAWELLIGALLATGAIPPFPEKARQPVAFLGAGLVLFGIFAFSDATPFPGWAALAPCLGTALLVHSGQQGDTSVARWLSLRPVVFVGLVSYSLYLWHWPLIVLCKHWLGEHTLRLPVASAAVAASFVLAVLSWRYVERPFRDRSRIARRTIFAMGGAAIAGALAISAAAIHGAGFPNRIDARVLELARGADDWDPRTHECLEVSGSALEASRLCELGAVAAADLAQSFVLWGDSHAGALIPAVSDLAEAAGRKGLFAGRSACPPLLGVTRRGESSGYGCAPFNEDVAAMIGSRPEIDTVVLAARWSINTEGTRYKEEAGAPIVLVESDSRDDGRSSNRAVFERGLERSLARLAKDGKQIVLLGPLPEVGLDVPWALAARARSGSSMGIGPSHAEFMERQGFVLETLRAASRRFGAPLLLPHESLCTPAGACRVERDGRALYIDDDHPSDAAMEALTRGIAGLFGAPPAAAGSH